MTGFAFPSSKEHAHVQGRTLIQRVKGWNEDISSNATKKQLGKATLINDKKRTSKTFQNTQWKFLHTLKA